PNPNLWLKRQAEGKISWIATLVPKYDISGQQSDQYTLSVVMLHDRPNDLSMMDTQKERTVLGDWQNPIAATGGEIRLTAYDPELLKLRPNDWVMVSGTYIWNSKPISRFQWYRVTECDPEP